MFKNAKIQSLLLPTDRFTEEQAAKYIEERGYHSKFGNKKGNVVVDSHTRFAQKNRNKLDSVNLVTLDFDKANGVKAEVEYNEKCFRAKGHKKGSDEECKEGEPKKKQITEHQCGDCQSKNIKKNLKEE